MPHYDDKMRLADNLIRIQQERNELLAQSAQLIEALDLALTAMEAHIEARATASAHQWEDELLPVMRKALAAAQVPL